MYSLCFQDALQGILAGLISGKPHTLKAKNLIPYGLFSKKWIKSENDYHSTLGTGSYLQMVVVYAQTV